MSKEIIAFDNAAQLPAALADKFGADAADNLISGGGAYPVLSIKGSKWRIKVEGEEIPLLNPETDDPLPSIELVIIRSGKGMTKNYYAKKYAEGDAESPDCFSHDGIVPDPQSEMKQCDSCAACPHNVWGSRVTEQGSKAKACSDSKTLAVTFTGDMENEALGGPMLLRVPPASLKDLSTFARAMKAKGYVPQQISIRMGFDINVAYPKLTFKAVRPLNAKEVAVIGDLYDGDQVSEIMHTTPAPQASKPAAQKAAEPDNTEFELESEQDGEAITPVVGKSKSAAVTPKAKAKPKAKAAPLEGELVEESEPVKASPESESTDSVVDSDIDDILGDLDEI